MVIPMAAGGEFLLLDENSGGASSEALTTAVQSIHSIREMGW